MLVGRLHQSELLEYLCYVSLDGALGYEQPPSDCAVGHAFRNEPKDLSFSLGELGQRVLSPPASYEARNDRRVDHSFAIHDASQCINNGCDVEDTLLEEITNSLGLILDKAHRVARLHVLREDENTNFRMLGSDRLCGDETFVGVRRRHPDVYDRDVWAIPTNGTKQSLGILCLAYDIDVCVLQQADYSLPG